MLEPLEQRISPAFVFHYTDVDGDAVTLSVSKGMLTDAHLVFDASGKQLQTLDLSAEVFVGADVSLSARPTKTGGDGLVNLGFLRGVTANAQGKTGLGNVTIDGDLGKFVSSPRTFNPLYPIQYEFPLEVAKSFHVHSLGQLGTATGAPDLFSLFDGKVDTFRVDTDVRGASARFAGDLRVLWVGGSVIGGTEIGSGAIFVTGDLGNGFIGGDVIGGVGQDSGRVGSETGVVKQLTVAGDLIGGTGKWSGMIGAHQLFEISGPHGDTIQNLKICGSVIGGSGFSAGGVYSIFDVDKTVIGGSIRDGGFFTPPGGKRLEIKGDVAGRVVVERLGELWIHGSIVGGTLDDTGIVRVLDESHVNKTKSFKIGGNIVGGDGKRSGQLVIQGAVQTGLILGDILGGGGERSGWLQTSILKQCVIGGDVVGGKGAESGTFRPGSTSPDQFSRLIVRGDVRSGSAPGSGLLTSPGAASVTVYGSVYGNAIVKEVIQGPLTVFGNVEDAILGSGFDNLGNVSWSGGILSKLEVRGNLIRSSIVDGALAGLDDLYGTGDDKMHPYSGSGGGAGYSYIQEVIIRGRIVGDPNSHDGIVAAEVRSLIVEGHKVKLTAGANNDRIEGKPGSNFTIQEIPRVPGV